MQGSIKKIDELGRIVIPRDIRKSLSIKANDSLEIGMVDNTIRIVKNVSIKNYEEVVVSLAMLFKKCDIDMLVTNREKVIYNTTDINDFDVRKFVSLSLYEMLEKKKDLGSNLDVRPIIIDSNVEGVVIVEKSKCNELVGELFNVLVTNELDITY